MNTALVRATVHEHQIYAFRWICASSSDRNIIVAHLANRLLRYIPTTVLLMAHIGAQCGKTSGFQIEGVYYPRGLILQMMKWELTNRMLDEALDDLSDRMSRPAIPREFQDIE